MFHSQSNQIRKSVLSTYCIAPNLAVDVYYVGALLLWSCRRTQRHDMPVGSVQEILERMSTGCVNNNKRTMTNVTCGRRENENEVGEKFIFGH